MKAVIAKILLSIGFWGAVDSFAQGTFERVVAPNGLDQTEGTDEDTNPFFERRQLVFDASQFSSLAPAGGWLHAMAFRLDAGGNSSGVTANNVQIRASNTSRTPDGLSPIFAENIGFNETLVFGAANINLGQTYNTFSNPQGFSTFFVVFSPHSFWYNPNQGNLLLDFSTESSVFSGPNMWDAVNQAGDGVASVRGLYGSSSGTFRTESLVTAFDFETVPEPSSLLLLLAGAAIFFAGTLIKRKA